MTSGTYKIALQTGSFSKFAMVSVEAHHSAGPRDAVSFAEGALGIFNWDEAVTRGVSRASRRLREIGAASEGLRVHVVRVVARPIEANDADVAWAAYMATLAAFMPQTAMPRLRYLPDGDTWAVDWPG